MISRSVTNNKCKFLVVTIMLLLSVMTISGFLGTFKQGEPIDLITAVNETALNITVYYPNNTKAVDNALMTKVGFRFNYTFTDASTTGKYIYDYCNQVGTCYVNDFDVTPSGRTASTSDSILYFLFSIILFGIIIGLFFFIWTLPSENEKDETGTIIGIVKLKYLRIILIAITYPLLIILFNLLNGLAVNFTTLSIFAGTLGFLFETMLRVAWVFTVIIIIWIFYLLIHDSNIRKNLRRLERL